MNGDDPLAAAARAETARIYTTTTTAWPPPPGHGPADPEVLAQLVDEMTSWEATYSRERRRRDHDRHRRKHLRGVA